METKQFGTFICEPVTVNIGAEISNIDLTQKLSQKELASLEQALVHYQVLFFRDQNLSPENHRDIAAFFGEPHIHPAYNHVEGFPEICILESTPNNPTKIELWHTDMTFSENPPMGSFLRGWDIPPVGGDTMWGSSHAAYEALPQEIKNKIKDKKAVHDFKYGFKESIAEKGEDHFAEAIKNNPPVEHPIIRTHPISGRKGLFVNPLFTTHIVGIDKKESDEILCFIYRHMIQEEFTVRFRWRKNSFAIWDNRSTIHRPVNDYLHHSYRQLRRITVKGCKPQ